MNCDGTAEPETEPSGADALFSTRTGSKLYLIEFIFGFRLPVQHQHEL